MELIKNNDNKDWDDLQWVNEFYYFLQGNLPDSIKMGNNPKLSEEQSFSIIWYLQEHFPLIPENIEKCDVCGSLYDSHREGLYTDHSNEKGHNNFCNPGCEGRFAFPVRSVKELLIKAKETLEYNPSYDWCDLVILMYEGNDSINRDEKYFLEDYFGKDGVRDIELGKRIEWLSIRIAEQKSPETTT